MINPEELLFSVDENNNPIEPHPRKLSHTNGIWHRAAHIWIINNKHQILCQQRSLHKDMFPGLWEPFFGGHLSPQQSYESCAISELQEELGIATDKHALIFVSEYKYIPGTEFQGIFILPWNGDISSLRLEKEEVEQVQWVDAKSVFQKTVIDKDPKWTHMGFEKTVIDTILNTHS